MAIKLQLKDILLLTNNEMYHYNKVHKDASD